MNAAPAVIPLAGRTKFPADQLGQIREAPQTIYDVLTNVS